MIEARVKDYGGDALYRKVILDAVQEAKSARPVLAQGQCFIAGTLVHTKTGTKPIEDIRVGDLVLSQPEETGERSYQPVVKTISFDEEQPVRIVQFYVIDPSMSQGGKFDQVITTANHPFWVKGSGWTRADELRRGLEIDLHDGRSGAGIFCSAPLIKTKNLNVAWAEGLFAKANDSSGELIFFEGNSFRIGSGSYAAPEGMFVEGGHFEYDEALLFKRKVYNFEVANTHTYYVGELGVWVHNTNCSINGVAFAEAQLGVRPSPNTHEKKGPRSNWISSDPETCSYQHFQAIVFIRAPSTKGFSLALL